MLVSTWVSTSSAPASCLARCGCCSTFQASMKLASSATPLRPVRCRARPVCRTSSAGVYAYRGRSDAVITVPLDYYKVLTINRASTPQTVREAYERQLRSPPNVGYSQDTLFSRAVLLRNAVECLQDYHRRREYDSMALNNAGYTADVSPQNLPAALVLLQETGQSGLVINLGNDWLQKNRRDPMACDVAAAVALAHCDEAADALHQDSSVVLTACQNLEAALQLLRQHKMAPQLQQQIMQTLEDYSPRYCLELLALPLDDSHQKQRQRGMTLLRKLAFGLPQDLSPVAQQERDSFLSSARSLLTPQELLNFYKALPTGARIDCQQKLDLALATVAAGYLQQTPHMVQQAAHTYHQLQEVAQKDGHELDVAVERAACSLMLGDAQQAQQLLGLTAGSSTPAAEHAEGSIGAFVLEHSPDQTDLLPGIYVLSERWLQEGVLGSFRQDAELADSSSSLAAWFDSKTVQQYIQAYSMLRSISILKVFQAIFNAIAAFFSWATSGKSTAAKKQIKAGRLHTQPGQSRQDIQPTARISHQPANEAATHPAAAQQHQLDEVDRPQQELNVSQLRQRLHGSNDRGSSPENQSVVMQQRRQLMALEAAMWDSTQIEQNGSFKKWPRMLAAVLGVASIAVAALCLRPSGARAPSAAPAAETWALASHH